MAKIKNTMTVSLEEFGKKAGEYALNEFEYKGLTVRQWADKITSGEYEPVVYCKDCKYRKEHHYENDGETPCIKYSCKFTKYSMSDTGYCSMGKMKDGD